jgi:hypothetical protein
LPFHEKGVARFQLRIRPLLFLERMILVVFLHLFHLGQVFLESFPQFLKGLLAVFLGLEAIKVL